VSLQRPYGPPAQDVRRRTLAALRLCTAAIACSAAAVAVAQAPHALIGHPAPDFTLHAASGVNVRLGEHRGEVVVVSFWGGGCGACRSQLAALDRSLATYASAGLTVYGIGVDDDPKRALEFAQRAKVGFPMLLDPGKAAGRAYDVDNLPMTVLIDRGGTVRYVLRDFSDRSDELYLRQLRALLNE
jgi:peroxiredoxin